ncbi:hypothetical protein CLOM_g23448 [Closterium sp. NIES-68]|nr:hypothetical protein CLOM_g23448 [Closterium sp. NIES-68]GJP72081.1 hypothetical protein CLOP_g2850 [Closterium sp. NIES-67]GJP72465.1 hypothetical protein CLOP_g3197 [Closterium sp. NIES-67]
MAQQQARELKAEGETPSPITMADVASKAAKREQLAAEDRPVTKKDAAYQQMAETAKHGKTLPGGPAATLQSAADKNVQMGVPLSISSEERSAGTRKTHESTVKGPGRGAQAKTGPELSRGAAAIASEGVEGKTTEEGGDMPLSAGSGGAGSLKTVPKED